MLLEMVNQKAEMDIADSGRQGLAKVTEAVSIPTTESSGPCIPAPHCVHLSPPILNQLCAGKYLMQVPRYTCIYMVTFYQYQNDLFKKFVPSFQAQLNAAVVFKACLNTNTQKKSLLILDTRSFKLSLLWHYSTDMLTSDPFSLYLLSQLGSVFKYISPLD